MFHWSIPVDTLAPIPAFARVLSVACETQYEPRYHHEGRLRKTEYPHVLYKYTLSGCGMFRDAAGEHPVEAGSGFLCNITDPDTAYYYPPSGREPWTFVYTCITGDAAFAMMEALLERHGPIYSLPRKGGMVEEMCRFERLGQSRLEVSAAESARLAGELFLQLLQSKTDIADRSDDALLVREALRIIDGSLERKLTATALARELRVSREHLTRIFSTRMGTSLYQYIIRRKIRHACQLIKEGTLATKEIAARLGYPDPGHFTRAFKSQVGMPPQEFRRHGIIPAW